MSFEALQRPLVAGVMGTAIALGGVASAEAAALPAQASRSVEAAPGASMPTPSPEPVPRGIRMHLPTPTTFFSPFAYQTSESVATRVPYAQAFTAIVPEGSAAAAVQQVEHEQGVLWPTRVTEVDVRGFASNEASYASPDAGIGWDNPANVTLATERGQRFAAQLEQQPVMRGVKVNVLKGVEEVVSPAQVASLRHVAAEHNMTLKQMVATYDAGGGDAAVRKALDFFQSDRAVEVTITTERALPLLLTNAEKAELVDEERASEPQREPAPQALESAGHKGSEFGTSALAIGAAASLALRRTGQNGPRTPQRQEPEPVPIESLPKEAEAEREPALL